MNTQKQISPKLVVLIFGILVLCFLLNFYIFAWTEPTEAPPGGNVEAPINIGIDEQWKEGELGIGYLTPPYDLPSGAMGASSFYDADDSSYYLDPTTGAKLGGDLEIEGRASTSEICLIGDCVTSWPGKSIPGSYQIQSFESQGIPPGWTTGGDEDWYSGDDDDWYDGYHSARNSSLQPGQRSWLDIDINFPSDGYLVFYWKVVGTLYQDHLIFCLDKDNYCYPDWKRNRFAITGGERNEYGGGKG